MIDFERTMDEIIDEAHHRQEMKLIKEQVANQSFYLGQETVDISYIVF